MVKAKLVLIFFGVLCLGTNSGIFSQNKSVQTTGDIILFTLPTATLVTTILIEDKQGKNQFLKALAINAATTFALKYVINKPRPYDNGNYGFPSGHSSFTFQSAAFIQRRYGWKYGIPAYALAGFTGASRIHAKKHDGWDVAVGILIGIGSSYLFTTPYQKEHLEITFHRGNNAYLLGLKFKF